jgi:hypothetical protein
MLSLPPDRVRITTGRLEGNVGLQERICDVAAGSDRDDIGDALSIVYWKDSDFDHNERTFKNICVLEIPIDHWATYDTV